MAREDAVKLFNELIRPADVKELTDKYGGEKAEDIVMEAMHMTTLLLSRRFVPVEGTTYDGKQVYVKA